MKTHNLRVQVNNVIWKYFKTVCAIDGLSIRSQVEQALYDYLKGLDTSDPIMLAMAESFTEEMIHRATHSQ